MTPPPAPPPIPVPPGRRLLADARGVVSVEFALWVVLVFAALLPVLDFGLYILNQQRLSTAVTAGAMIGYTDRTAETLPTAQIATYVTQASGFAANDIAVTLSCNGGLQSCSVDKADRTCACVSGSPASYTAATTCGTTCPSGATSGFYLTVRAAHIHRSIVANPWLNGKQAAIATTVRLQ